MQPHRRQPTRLPHPWDSPGKNTGVGCHFLLQCMKVKSESEVAQSCPTLCDPMDCSPPGSSARGLRASISWTIRQSGFSSSSGHFQSLTLLTNALEASMCIWSLVWEFISRSRVVVRRVSFSVVCFWLQHAGSMESSPLDWWGRPENICLKTQFGLFFFLFLHLPCSFDSPVECFAWPMWHQVQLWTKQKWPLSLWKW